MVEKDEAHSRIYHRNQQITLKVIFRSFYAIPLSDEIGLFFLTEFDVYVHLVP